MSNNIQIAVAIGSDYKLTSLLGEMAEVAINKLLEDPSLRAPDRELLGAAAQICKEIKYSNSIHRAIEYAEKELK